MINHCATISTIAGRRKDPYPTFDLLVSESDESEVQWFAPVSLQQAASGVSVYTRV